MGAPIYLLRVITPLMIYILVMLHSFLPFFFLLDVFRKRGVIP
jgi:hypothetical protein